MKEKLDLEFVRYDRHNLMNDLQLIYGFLQMDRPKDAMRSTENLIAKINKEGKLLKAKLPQFGYLLKMNNYHNRQIRLSYQIKTENNLEELDPVLRKDTEEFLNMLKEYLSKDNIYHIFLQLEDLSPEELQISLIFKNFTLENTNFYNKCQTNFQVNNFKIIKEDKTHYSWTYKL